MTVCNNLRSGHANVGAAGSAHRKRAWTSTSFFAIALALNIIFQKNVFNEDADVSGSFAASSAAYLVAASIAFLVLANVVYYGMHITVLPASGIFLSIAFFYIYALITSPASGLPALTAFRALSGAGYVIIAGHFGRLVAKRGWVEGEKQVYHLILLTALALAVGAYMFNVNIMKKTNPLNIQAGSGALLFMFLSLWKLIDYRFRFQKKDIFFAALFAVVGVLLHSFSSILALGVTLLALLFISGRHLLFLVTISLIAASVFAFIQYLYANPDSIVLGKPARAYLIGSGRFAMYEYAFETYKTLTLDRQIFGVGFMAERELFVGSDLSWSINLHNSFLSNLLGTGVVGLTLSMLFGGLPFLARRKVIKNTSLEIYFKWISMHVMFLAYGMSSIDYPSSPSPLLLIFLCFTAFVLGARRDRKPSAGVRDNRPAGAATQPAALRAVGLH